MTAWDFTVEKTSVSGWRIAAFFVMTGALIPSRA
jgi:hypothetical protein